VDRFVTPAVSLLLPVILHSPQEEKVDLELRLNDDDIVQGPRFSH
jgi:hypothetical protein